MIYGYARCSTSDDKQDIKRQVRDLKNMDVPVDNIYFEYESGAKLDRKQYMILMGKVVDGDCIACTEVSRITRSTKQLCDIIELAKEKHLKLIFGGFVVDCTKKLDPMTEGMLKMMGIFAELERNMISERVKSGMANAMAKGSKIGRPETTQDNLPTQFLKHYPKLKNKQINLSEFSRLCGVSRQSIYKYIKIYEGREV